MGSFGGFLKRVWGQIWWNCEGDVWAVSGIVKRKF